MIDPSTAAMFDPAAVSAETRAFNRELAATLAELPKVHEVPPEVTRAARREGKGVFPLGGPLEGSSWAAIDPSGEGPGRVRLSQPKGPPRAIYVHIHGGGWTLGAPDQYDRHNQALAERTGMRVVSIQYRLAPEHPWPAQREDCLRALRWILSGTDRPLFMGGESAGAHLAAVCALDLRAIGGLDRLRGLVLNYGLSPDFAFSVLTRRLVANLNTGDGDVDDEDASTMGFAGWTPDDEFAVAGISRPTNPSLSKMHSANRFISIPNGSDGSLSGSATTPASDDAILATATGIGTGLAFDFTRTSSDSRLQLMLVIGSPSGLAVDEEVEVQDEANLLLTGLEGTPQDTVEVSDSVDLVLTDVELELEPNQKPKGTARAGPDASQAYGG
jgi:acetyl esterase/lipase